MRLQPKAKFKTMEFRGGNITDKLIDAWVREEIRNAAIVWIDAALQIIPSWSGASRATLEALGDAVNYPRPIFIGTAAGAPLRVALGRMNSSGGVRKYQAGTYEFYYRSTLEYLFANETKVVAPRTEGLFGAMRTPTPFMFRAAGDAMAQFYVSQLELPLPKSGLFGRRINV